MYTKEDSDTAMDLMASIAKAKARTTSEAVIEDFIVGIYPTNTKDELAVNIKLGTQHSNDDIAECCNAHLSRMSKEPKKYLVTRPQKK